MRRAPVVLLAAASAVAVLALSTRVWVDAALSAGVPTPGGVQVVGSSAAPLVPALAFVALAAAGALTIAGRRARAAVLALIALAGAGVAAAAVRVVLEPLEAARAGLGAATGLTPASVDGLDVTVRSTVWPFACAVLGALLVVVAVAGLRARHRWDETRRFDRDERGVDADVDADADRRDGWDALSRGDDPTRP